MVAFLKASGLGPCIEDGWIFLSLAKNIASGRGFSLDSVSPAQADTSMLWTLALAVIHWATDNAELTASLAAMLSFGCLASGVYALFRTDSRSVAITCTVATITTAPTLWLSSGVMESNLFLGLSFLAIATGLRRNWGKAGVWAVLAAYTRPEGMVIVPGLLGLAAAWDQRPKEAGQITLDSCSAWVCRVGKEIFPAAVVVTIGVGLLLAFNLNHFGSLLPSTLAGKLATHHLHPEMLGYENLPKNLAQMTEKWADYAWKAWFGNGLLWAQIPALIFAGIGFFGIRKNRAYVQVLLFSGLINLAYALVLPISIEEFGRYQAGNFLLLPLLVGVGIETTWQWRPRHRHVSLGLKTFLASATVLLLVHQAFNIHAFARGRALQLEILERVHASGARWVLAHNPDRLPILVGEIGRFGYEVSGQTNAPDILDPLGLEDPTILAHILEGRLPSLLQGWGCQGLAFFTDIKVSERPIQMMVMGADQASLFPTSIGDTSIVRFRSDESIQVTLLQSFPGPTGKKGEDLSWPAYQQVAAGGAGMVYELRTLGSEIQCAQVQ